MLRKLPRQRKVRAALPRGFLYQPLHRKPDVAEALLQVLDPADWTVFQTLSVAAMAAWLLELAGRVVTLRKYRKHPRGPKKTPPKRTHNRRRPHVSVARILTERKAQRKRESP